MAGPPLRDGADALRTTRLEVDTAKPDGKVTCRNCFVTDPDVTHANVAEIAACGRARRRIGNGTFNVPGTDGYDPEHDFGRDRGGPANLPVAPDLPAFAAHHRLRPERGRPATHRPDPRRTQAPIRAHTHAHRPCGAPLTDRPRHRRHHARRRPDTSNPPSSTQIP